MRTTETTATICNCHYNCCLHSCTDGRYSLELYLNCTQQTNQNYFAADFFIIIIYFARQNTETSSPLNVYSATVFGLCTALSRLMGRKYGMYEVYGTHGCLFSIHIRWMRMEGCFCVTVYVVGCCCGGWFFFLLFMKIQVLRTSQNASETIRTTNQKASVPLLTAKLLWVLLSM